MLDDSSEFQDEVGHGEKQEGEEMGRRMSSALMKKDPELRYSRKS